MFRLSKRALEVVSAMKELFGDMQYAFPSMMSGKNVLSESSINSALVRMGVKKSSIPRMAIGRLPAVY
ncbi:hypothetical protein HRR99_18025 [Agrobacterium vaccinii]|uniref:hypothetical protein n=1 Tax=Agrobacterium vaccinii TaxID=2735528 RepID=UPI001E3CCE4E|nr:hypothetical protein [Agrobacterium vaccinii]UHS63472.1 hypothetical protein HRR99_18025 [Agrobacterium vaccinii]